MAFKSVSAPEMPNIACIGEVTSIEDTKVSKKGVYNVTPISITPRGGGFPSKLYFLSRPEWLAPDFTPDVDLEGQKGAQFVYSRNIQNYKGKGPAIISGLAGSQERADKLIDEIQASAKQVEDGSGSTISAVPEETLDALLRKYTAGVVVGYVLKQKQEDTGEVEVDPDTGKSHKVYIRTTNYELDQLFFPDAKALAKYRKLAAEDPTSWKVGFDDAF